VAQRRTPLAGGVNARHGSVGVSLVRIEWQQDARSGSQILSRRAHVLDVAVLIRPCTGTLTVAQALGLQIDSPVHLLMI